MLLLLSLNRVAIKQYRHHYQRRFITSTALWLNNLTNKLQYTQLQRLAVDESLSPQQNQQPRLVKNALFTPVDPTPLESPQLLSISSAVTTCIDLDTNITNDKESMDTLTQLFAGNIETIRKIIPNCSPYSHCYAGHQFGNFAGQLGDGRAINLCEFVNDKNEIWEIQLKGSGLTPFSRFLDGRAVLRSSIREYFISEAMHYLGIPTTRAGMLIISDTDTVIRDEFYNGNSKREKIAIVLRLSPSFIRFGSFEICSKKGGPSYNANDSQHSNSLLKPLLDYIIQYHYPEIYVAVDSVSELEMYELWWKELVDKTIRLLVKWQCFGFVHGVLNTDNMSILGLTVDYGPFAFMEYFNDEFVANYSDHSGRYSYKKQAEICQWNLDRLAEALDDAHILNYNVTKPYISNINYNALYDKYYKDSMILKFGLLIDAYDCDVGKVVECFFDALQQTACDFTNAFRALNMVSVNTNNGDMEMEDNKLTEYLVSQCATPLQFTIIKYPQKSTQLMTLRRGLPNLRKMADSLRENPELNSMAGLTLDDLQAVFDHFDRKEVVKTIATATNNGLIEEMTIAEKKEHDRNVWKVFVQMYRNAVNKQYVGNDQQELLRINEERIKRMNENNPKYILRNYMLQNCINKAENGEYDEIESLLQLIKDPFNEQLNATKNDYVCPAPDWTVSDCVSCSS